MVSIQDTVGVSRLSSCSAPSLASSGQHALHPQGLLWMVEAEKDRLTETQHAPLCQTMGLGDGQAIYGALVSTWVQGDAACLVFNVAVLSCDAIALQRDICHPTAQRGSPFQQWQQGDGGAQTPTSQTNQVGALCLDFQGLACLNQV